jgi:hypothetical protein
MTRNVGEFYARAKPTTRASALVLLRVHHYCVAQRMFRSSFPPRPSEFYSVQAEAGYIRVVRSALRFEDERQVRAERLNLGLILDSVGRKGRLLIDSRLAPASTDFELGVEFKALRRELERGFTKVAVLVQTKLGVLQANRIRQEDQSRVLKVFENEQEAIVFLQGK